MSAIIRLSRCAGRKNLPFYWLVLTDKRKRRDSGFKHKLGYYNPISTSEQKMIITDVEKFKKYVACGAEISDRVKKLVSKNNEYSSFIK